MDRFYIGFNDRNGGLQTNLKPFLINDNAFSVLKNAYVYRGRVRKRFGSQWMGETQLSSRLRFEVDTADGSGTKLITYPTGLSVEIGQMISINDSLFTIYQTGIGDPLLSTNTNWSAEVTSSTSITLTFSSGAPTASTPIYVYPALPVMGITTYYSPSTNSYNTFAFDTTFSYRFDDPTQAWLRLDGEGALSPGASVWTGSDARFFWMTNYQGATSNLNYLWVTNNTTDDGIRYYDGVNWNKPILNWTIGSNVGTTDGSGNASIVLTGPFFPGQVVTVGVTSFTFPALPAASVVVLTPTSTSPGGTTGTATFNTGTDTLTITGAYANTSVYFSGDNYIGTSLLIVSFKNRLLLFNTTEIVNGVATIFRSRVRYSGIGSPLYASSWQQDFPGNGSALDAPTDEPIITAQFIKDRLIVYFGSSTYELAYTGNQVLPFVWQKINTELGADSTFSEVPFDKVVLGISNIGIHACNGTGVERIDSKIPQLAFDISTQESGSDRVAGIRDYYTEMVYWTFPSSNRSDNFYFPNQVLVYNYVNDSWGLNDDSFTTFGYFLLEPQTAGDLWGDTNLTWQESGSVWNSNFDASTNVKFQSVVAGNQQGYVVIVQPSLYQNAPALQVTDFTSTGITGVATVQCINHNLEQDDFVIFSSMNGIVFTNFNGDIIPTAAGKVVSDTLNNDTPNSFQIQLIDNDINAISFTGSYLGGGVMARISQIDIYTKQYNFYANQDRNVTINKVDFLVDKTDNGAVTIDYFVSSATDISMVEGAEQTGSLLGNSVLETSAYQLVPLESYQTRIWHPVYIAANGECIQLRIYISDAQMTGYALDTDNNGTVIGCQYTALNNFELNAMIFYARPSSYRMQ